MSKGINGKTDVISAALSFVSETIIYHIEPTVYKKASPAANAKSKNALFSDLLEMNDTKSATIGYAKIKPPVNDIITLTDPKKPENTGNPTAPSKT